MDDDEVARLWAARWREERAARRRAQRRGAVVIGLLIGSELALVGELAGWW